MKKLFLFVLISSFLQISYPQKINETKIPSTTKSKYALQLYDSTLLAWKEGRLHHLYSFANQTLKEDPDFFLMNYYMALSYRWFKNDKLFRLYAGNAAKCQEKLSYPEELLRGAMIKMLENPSVNVTDIGKKIVNMYPNDLYSYLGLIFLQVSCGDNNGQVETINKALLARQDSAVLYDLLGYAYMRLNKFDSAEIAFDKYLKYNKYKPNAYDSKGNYFKNIKNYQKAYDTWMKGYSLDTTFKMPYQKAINLKKNILDTLKIK